MTVIVTYSEQLEQWLNYLNKLYNPTVNRQARITIILLVPVATAKSATHYDTDNIDNANNNVMQCSLISQKLMSN